MQNDKNEENERMKGKLIGEKYRNMDRKAGRTYGLERRKDIRIGEQEEKGTRDKERNMDWREGRGGLERRNGIGIGKNEEKKDWRVGQ